MYSRNVQQNPLLVEPCVTEEFSISPRFSPMIFYPHANSVLLRAHLCTAVLLLVHLCTVLLIGSMRRTLCSKLFMMGALRPIYTHVQRECSADFSVGRTLCDWGVFHLSSVLANDFWSPYKFSALTRAPFDPHASSVFLRAHVCTAKLLLAHLCTAELIGSMRRTLCSKSFMMRAWRPIYTYAQQDCSAEPSMVEPYGTEEVSTSSRFSPMIFSPRVKSVFLRAHVCTAVRLLVHLCTAVLIGSMRTTLQSKLSMMRA